MPKPPSTQDESPFFERLARWDDATRAMEAFDRFVDKPISASPAAFQANLYRLLIDHLLEWLRLPRSDGAVEWEWKSLYRFGADIDPYYFTEASIHRLLERWPTIGGEARDILFSALKGYFHLRRGGFPAGYPSALLSAQESERWMGIFPPEWAWDSLAILHRMGISTLAGSEGYRCYLRFSEGAFSPQCTPGTLRIWQSACWQGAHHAGRGEDDAVAPHRVHFLAMAFAGRFRSMGVEGCCGEIPDCPPCPLRGECRWHNAPAGEKPGPSEILALAGRGQLDHLRTDRLLEGLFRLDPSAAGQLKGKLGERTLREVAAYSYPEQKEMFGFERLLPERMRIAFELCRRFNEERMHVGRAFQTPAEVFRHFKMRLRDLKQEQFIVVLLDNRKRYLNDIVVTQGTLNTSPVHPREVFNAAIRESAASVIIVHNHPSGDPHPSKEDLAVTRQLLEVGALVGIPVLDHIIVADDRYTSMMEQGLIKF